MITSKNFQYETPLAEVIEVEVEPCLVTVSTTPPGATVNPAEEENWGEF